ncbi:PepSY domain-containing protein [Sulfuricurvum sp.]|uniref:PepSY domain-containing protein n=1 Tax=Sulfuricurvum sp. TaxID=2025608 RepID=UPI00260652E4|nr:PepSY domain-containing protein [Sulfuricurvum sp.]MDD2267707.1 PepSY domain-containing protein [Sulfuricurvum sp.]MDD2949165.1 PepSY domain-containing protein [Sulfuricurvum sp.]
MKKVTTITLVTLLTASAAFAYTGSEMAKKANVTMPEAQKIALKTYAGIIIDEELEKESGGSGLRYSFVIKQGKVSHEVGVDAKDGKILENKVEGPNAD